MRAADPPAVDPGALAVAVATGSLYARVMGDAWFTLAAPIRDLHSAAPATHASGRLRIEHGHGLLARIIARAIRLPAPGAEVHTELSVTTVDDGERWDRAFGATRIDTHQCSDGVDLVERYGALEFRFRLHAADGCLVYRQREAALRLSTLGLRLPGYLAPHIDASEVAVSPGRVKITVNVTLPMIGLLIAYEGAIDVAEPRP